MVIKYRDGYKYQLAETYRIEVEIPLDVAIRTEFIDLEPIDDLASVLVIKSGYAWDGPSGPTFDTKDAMRGSLVHDALYQLMRQECLPLEVRMVADNIFRAILIKSGMDKHRAKRWYKGVKYFASDAADPSSAKEVHEAP